MSAVDDGPASWANSTDPSSDVIKNLGLLFYIVDPKKTSFPDLKSMPNPNYIQTAFPYFFVMITIEWIILYFKGKTPRLSEGMLSVSHGLIMQFMEFFVSGLTFSAYMYIYTNHRIYELQWDSLFTWIVAAIGIDFGYYWVHRAAHEVNLLWAAHQVHHSSEDYNLATALRQSAFQGLGAWPFYLPMAFFVPPSHAIIHKELNLLYQFWIHTELVRTIGPFDYILNTASHHKVHHGANRYCLDKNYAGVLIIWDRLFGTFEAERDDLEIVYGLVDQPQFFNPLKHQVFYYGKVVEKAASMKTWGDSVSAFFKGPGWFPGLPRLGDVNFVEEKPDRAVYKPDIFPLTHVYTVLHFVFTFILADTIARTSSELGQTTSICLILYSLWTLSNIGLIYDGSKVIWLSELARCSLSLVVLSHLVTFLVLQESVLFAVYAGSAVVCGLKIGYNLLNGSSKSKEE